MHDLISTLVPPKHQDSAGHLLHDADTRNLIRQQLCQMAEDHTGVIPQHSFNWILCKLATFGAGESDTIRIYQAFLSQLNQLGQMCCQLSRHGTDYRFDSPAVIASRLTIGLGLFYETAARRHQYRAAPSPQYYEQVAASCFAITGHKRIATQLPQWLEFLKTNFRLPQC